MNNKSKAEPWARSSGLESEGEGLENEGELNRIAARRDNEPSREFVTPEKAAMAAIEGPEDDELRDASEIEKE
jgi:hypothetical protein